MLKTIRFAALGREQANNRGKPVKGENPTMFAMNKTRGVLFCIIHQGLCLCKAYAVYVM